MRGAANAKCSITMRAGVPACVYACAGSAPLRLHSLIKAISRWRTRALVRMKEVRSGEGRTRLHTLLTPKPLRVSCAPRRTTLFGERRQSTVAYTHTQKTQHVFTNTLRVGRHETNENIDLRHERTSARIFIDFELLKVCVCVCVLDYCKMPKNN